MTPSEFHSAFHKLTGHTPFAWQTRLFFDHFARAELPDALDIPTGLGKTSVLALWYLARRAGVAVSRRVVYVVDRRAIVDQATETALTLKQADPDLRISTLRGQHVDNRAWLEAPSAPAIIVGTVDMIGSRLLFSGYGVRPAMRPYHAGLLGCDTLVVLDEAHLVPPFEQLLADIHNGTNRFGVRAAPDRTVVPPFRLLSLSATGRERPGTVFRLCDADLDATTRERLDAEKRLIVEPPVKVPDLVAAMADRAWKRAEGGRHVIVFCNSRKVAEGVHAGLLGQCGEDNIELIVGARRIFERDSLVQSEIFRRFAPKTAENARKGAGGQPGFLVCTSAGEVGVDLDAEHMVCDLVAWERMVQRLGRVNRIGTSHHRALIDVFPATFDNDKEVEDAIGDAGLKTLRAPFEFSAWEIGKDGRRDASTGALRRLGGIPEFRVLTHWATTPPPLRPALTRALLDGWAMTSLDEHTGRPEIAPWLRGWIETRAPNTSVVWRTYLPARPDDTKVSEPEITGFFNAAPPHASEMLETETWRVLDWLTRRARARGRPSVADPLAHEVATELPAQPDTSFPETAEASLLQPQVPAAFVLSTDGKLKRPPLTLQELRDLKGRSKDDLEADLQGCVLVVDARMRGLKPTGLLDAREDALPQTADGSGWKLDSELCPDIGFQIHRRSGAGGMSLSPGATFGFALTWDAEGDPQDWLEIVTRTTEQSRATARNEQLLTAHVDAVVQCANRIATELNLEGDYRNALLLAARLHDQGKEVERWQRAFSAPKGGIYGKTKGPLRNSILAGYRHEFGSLQPAEDEVERSGLPEPLRDLVLHLIAAHHGRARPLIETDGCEDAPPFLLATRARAVAMRFARLQERWGPWGLAWWESLLRAADQQASRENDPEPAIPEQAVR